MLNIDIDSIINTAIAFGMQLIVALIVLFIGTKVIKRVVLHLRKSFSRTGMEDGLAQFICGIIRFALYFVLVLVIASGFGVTTASVIAILGSSGITLGLALQGSLANFAGGVLILIQKPFVVGDFIREDTNKNEGYVEHISLIYTRLKTDYNTIVVIPNGTLANASLINFTTLGYRISDLTIAISYDSDLKVAMNILWKLLHEESRVIDDKRNRVFIRNLGEVGISMGVRFMTSVEDYASTCWDYLEYAKIELEENGIKSPNSKIQVCYEQN